MSAAENEVPAGDQDGCPTAHKTERKLLIACQPENRLTELLKNAFGVPSAMPERTDLNRPSAARSNLSGKDQRNRRLLILRPEWPPLPRQELLLLC
jgi:hypothetical protein